MTKLSGNGSAWPARLIRRPAPRLNNSVATPARGHGLARPDRPVPRFQSTRASVSDTADNRLLVRSGTFLRRSAGRGVQQRSVVPANLVVRVRAGFGAEPGLPSRAEWCPAQLVQTTPRAFAAPAPFTSGSGAVVAVGNVGEHAPRGRRWPMRRRNRRAASSLTQFLIPVLRHPWQVASSPRQRCWTSKANPLPQTDQRPTLTSAAFKERIALVAQAILTGNAEPASVAFFPLVAYQQVKDVA